MMGRDRWNGEIFLNESDDTIDRLKSDRDENMLSNEVSLTKTLRWSASLFPLSCSGPVTGSIGMLGERRGYMNSV